MEKDIIREGKENHRFECYCLLITVEAQNL